MVRAGQYKKATLEIAKGAQMHSSLDHSKTLPTRARRPEPARVHKNKIHVSRNEKQRAKDPPDHKVEARHRTSPRTARSDKAE